MVTVLIRSVGRVFEMFADTILKRREAKGRTKGEAKALEAVRQATPIDQRELVDGIIDNGAKAAKW